MSFVTLVLYGVFLVEPIRHRDYFLSDSGEVTASSAAARRRGNSGKRRPARRSRWSLLSFMAKGFAGFG